LADDAADERFRFAKPDGFGQPRCAKRRASSEEIYRFEPICLALAVFTK
jgi:hypothetical protein